MFLDLKKAIQMYAFIKHLRSSIKNEFLCQFSHYIKHQQESSLHSHIACDNNNRWKIVLWDFMIVIIHIIRFNLIKTNADNFFLLMWIIWTSVTTVIWTLLYTKSPE